MQRLAREFDDRVMDMFDRFDTLVVNGSKDAKDLLKHCDEFLDMGMIGNTFDAEWKAEKRRAKS